MSTAVSICRTAAEACSVSSQECMLAVNCTGFIPIIIADWSAVDPMDYLTPFMEVIRSPETSGPITGVALTAVSRFLDTYIIGNDSQHHTQSYPGPASSLTVAAYQVSPERLTQSTSMLMYQGTQVTKLQKQCMPLLML